MPDLPGTPDTEFLADFVADGDAHGRAFLLFRQDGAQWVLDVAHVHWIDLVEKAPEPRGNGLSEVILQGEAVAVSGFDEARRRKPRGPWPVIVVEMNGRRTGIVADEVGDVISDPRTLRELAGADGMAGGPRIRVATAADLFGEP